MWRRMRRATQVLSVLLLLSPLAGLTVYLGTYSASLLLGMLHLADPYAALQVGVVPLAVAALPVVLLNLVFGRVFCGWVCPLGFLLEGVDWLRRRLGLRERALPPWARWPLAGTLLALSLLAGQPLFEWLSPQANLARLFLFGLAWEALVIPLVALADLLLYRRLWCASLCPAGVTYGLIARAGALRVALDREKCHRCGDCLNACPQGRAVLTPAVSGRGAPAAVPDACISCGECIDVCAREALGFRLGRAQPVAQADPSRRAALLTLGASAAVSVLAFGRAALALPERTVIRPPGALPEPLFKALCVRCGKCAQICPLDSVKLDNGLPYLNLREAACDMCRECPPVCPTGALTLAPEEPIAMGTAVVDHDLCWAWNGQICRSCFAICPLQGKALLLESAGGIQRPVIDPAVCTGCGLCEHTCPVEPSAIYVKPS
ncbi:MAG TPA: 4Fe-4S dicluster domain-containing protein [Symbiobacteriaceae bacterium]|nr:4Fe-4S dicluster domain-containing protein [Symbiobacteriaceae bacterium]